MPRSKKPWPFWPNGPDRDEISSFYLDSILCEHMGWKNVDCADFFVLRGFHPESGKLKWVPSYSSSANASAILVSTILREMRYPKSNSTVSLKLEGGQDGNGEIGYRAVFGPMGRAKEPRFECRSWSQQHAIAVAAVRMFKAIGPLPSLSDMYSSKSRREEWKKDREKLMPEDAEWKRK